MAPALWALVERQHGVVSRAQLLELGVSGKAIAHRLRNGRLHRVIRGVYAVGRPELTRHGRWMAAVLACGPGAVLSHGSAAALWQIRPEWRREIEITVPRGSRRTHSGIRVRRRNLAPGDITTVQGIPVTTPVRTLVDVAGFLSRDPLEAAINEADKLDLVNPVKLREALDGMPHQPGAPHLRKTLDRRTFVMSDSTLERYFRPIARRAGLRGLLTQQRVNGFKVDFYSPELGIVVETDGLRYHRTPAEQARDHIRDQTHAAAGLIPLRFTHEQVRYDPGYVERTLAAVAARRLAAQQVPASKQGSTTRR
jgi:very-short-patch-repair endonuclease